MTNDVSDKPSSWLDRPALSLIPPIKTETILFALIILLAIFTRFYDLGARVMSHDESLHTYYSWKLYKGDGFEHTPMMHGPLQFHLIALSYSFLGDSDFTSRVPAALFSIATVALLWKFRRYLGKAGALIAAFLMTISPYMLYYGRYARNEAIVIFVGLLALYSILRYLETGSNRYLYVLALATVIHFTAKETSYIYVALTLIFLAVLFIAQVARRSWRTPQLLYLFLALIAVVVLLFGAAAGIGGVLAKDGQGDATQTAIPANPNQLSPLAPPQGIIDSVSSGSGLVLLLVGIGVILLFFAFFILLYGIGWNGLRSERSFDLLILLGSLILPCLVAFPIKLLGWDALDYGPDGLQRIALFLIPLFVISGLIGIWWKPRAWLISAAIFYGIFVVFQTTVFTNWGGIFSGLTGSLGYWLEQQSVERGSQPWYFYMLIQLPLYEYLPFIGGIAAIISCLWQRLVSDRAAAKKPARQAVTANDTEPPALPLLIWWAAGSLLAFTVAGEKMPWLTVHVAMPFILLCGWWLGRQIEAVDWKAVGSQKGIVSLLLLVVLITSSLGWLGALLGPNIPFQGKTLEEQQATNAFLFSLIVSAASAAGLVYVSRGWVSQQVIRLGGLVFMGLLGLLTLRTSIAANYVNYDQANEYLVYAHSAVGVKDVMGQVEELSRRTAGALNIQVAFDDDVSWPFTWYLRNYPNQRYYAAEPTRDLRTLPVILVGDNNFDKIESVVGQSYHKFEYIRMVWPNQDYFGLTWERVWSALSNPTMRQAIFDIWLNRDLTAYASVTGSPATTLENWQPSDRMRMYIRNDVLAQVWRYGVSATSQEIEVDPYEKGMLDLASDLSFGNLGSESGQFQAPRSISIGPDDTIYVADSRNHRIQQLGSDGSVLHVWGQFADQAAGPAEGGTFNEPWGVAYSPAADVVYVADTWNHRIQKFTSDGQFLKMWGHFGQGEDPEAFWGPRGLAVDSRGRVYVTDTGNKRVVVFDADGNFVTQFGEVGMDPGQFNEPVGIAIDSDGRVYVADTWNQRMQILAPDDDGIVFTPLKTWDINGWYSQSLDNKPFVALDGRRNVYVADPEGYRVLVFDSDGNYLHGWGDYGIGPDGFGMVSGVAVDSQGKVWISDGVNGRILRFTVPQ